MVSPGHAPTDAGNTHDVYVELSGPSASDVHHNFVQRWNEASDRNAHDGLWPDTASQDQLRFPDQASPNAGDAVVQIQRTVRRERYTDGTATPGGAVFPIEQGETSIVNQYLQAIDAAQRTLYLEDQAIGAPQILDALSRALRRGVRVAFVVPITPNSEMAQARRDPRNAAFFDALGALGQFENFTLAGLATRRSSGEFQNVYVHAKIGLIDDAWCTIGSANVANRSFYGDTELNVSIWHGPTVRASFSKSTWGTTRAHWMTSPRSRCSPASPAKTQAYEAWASPNEASHCPSIRRPTRADRERLTASPRRLISTRSR